MREDERAMDQQAMHERELRAFVLVADSGRIDQAATELGHSQPAVSYQIRCLEQDLGMKLFIRNAAGLRLTPEGAMVLPTVRAILALIEGIRGIPAPVGA